MIKYKKNKPTMHPVLKFIILLAVYVLGYISGNNNQKQVKTEMISTISYDQTNEINPSDNKTNDSEYSLTYDISYSELNKNEKELYDKIISTAINKDNTFITDRELNFILNTTISKDESTRVQFVLYKNYPDVKFYTTRYPDSWIYYITHYINGVPIYRTYYFNVKYK